MLPLMKLKHLLKKVKRIYRSATTAIKHAPKARPHLAVILKYLATSSPTAKAQAKKLRNAAKDAQNARQSFYQAHKNSVLSLVELGIAMADASDTVAKAIATDGPRAADLDPDRQAELLARALWWMELKAQQAELQKFLAKETKRLKQVLKVKGVQVPDAGENIPE